MPIDDIIAFFRSAEHAAFEEPCREKGTGTFEAVFSFAGHKVTCTDVYSDGALQKATTVVD